MSNNSASSNNPIGQRAKLATARKAKQDEFYTQLTDIEKELRYYKEHFEGKTVLCNCDDPFESNFFKYFVLNFNRLGIKKLITTCYTGSPIANQQLSLFDVAGNNTNERDANRAYKAVVTKVYDTTGDGGIDMTDVAELFKTHENELVELTGNGDFRSEECVELLDEADIVVTNPPFSLFREYISLLVERDKKFLVLGNVNAITYKDIFPLLKNNKVWLGHQQGGMTFEVPEHYEPKETAYRKDEVGRQWRTLGNVCWFTNMDIKKRHEEIILYKRYTPEEYPSFDNYDGINVDKVKDIPCDYPGVMGVPITFLDKYNPNQFEILGLGKIPFEQPNKIYSKQTQISSNGRRSIVTALNTVAAIKVAVPPVGKTYYEIDGEYFVTPYARILVRNKHPETPKET